LINYDIFGVTKQLIEEEQLEEVTSTKVLVRIGEFDPKGLGSNEIFGYTGTKERKQKFAYIELGDIFIHPHVLLELKSLKAIFLKCVNGEGEYWIDNGMIAVVDEKTPTTANKGNGAKWLKSVWKDLVWNPDVEKKGSVRYNRIRFMKYVTEDQVFIDKLLVIPPFYRDIDIYGSTNNEYNNIYVKLINLAFTIKNTSSFFTLFGDVSDAHRLITATLIDFYTTILKKYGGRKGFAHENVMGKSIDFASRLVISGYDGTNIDSPRDMDVTFDKTNPPLHAIIKCFAPFIMKGVRDIIRDYLQGYQFLYVDEEGEDISAVDNIMLKRAVMEKDVSHYESKTKRSIKRVKLASDWEHILSADYLQNQIELFESSHERRLDPVELPLEDGRSVAMIFYPSEILEESKKRDLEEEMKFIAEEGVVFTWLHLFYMAAYDTIRDKHVYITRYPIESHNSTYPAKINLVPYVRNAKMRIGDEVYPHFPVINRKSDMIQITKMFRDTLILFPSYLKTLGADFDGDQVSMVGVFTEEANKDANDWIYNVGNFIGSDGGTVRSLGTWYEHNVYHLTLRKKGEGIGVDGYTNLINWLKSNTPTVADDIIRYRKTKFNLTTKKVENNPTNIYSEILLQPGDLANAKVKTQTNIGTILFNKVVLVDNFGDKFDFYGDEKAIKLGNFISLYNQKLTLGQITTEELGKIYNSIVWLNRFMEMVMPGMSKNVLVPSKRVKALKQELYQKYAKEIAAGDEKVFVKEIQNVIMNEIDKDLENDPAKTLYDLKKPSKGNNLREMIGVFAPIKDISTDKFLIHTSCLEEGIKKDFYDYMINSNVTGTYGRAVATQNGGAIVKSIYDSMNNLMAADKDTDCGSKMYKKVTLTKDNKSYYQWCHFLNENGEIQLMKPDIIDRYLGKELQFRSPIFCNWEDRNKICNKCIGEIPYLTKLMAIGNLCGNIGFNFVQASLKGFHDSSVKLFEFKLEDWMS
jgi:hypothetical protein